MERQIIGTVLVVLLLNVLYLSRAVWSDGRAVSLPLMSEQKGGYCAVQLRGPAIIEGVYFVPAKTPLRALLVQLPQVDVTKLSEAMLNRLLQPGDVISISAMDDARPVPSIAREAMGNAQRRVLGMPMDVNAVGLKELTMVPGIGEKTATAILDKRRELNGFRQVEDLIQVRGIGEKKLQRFKKYLYVKS